MTTCRINNGPMAADIFTACLYGCKRGWSTPNEFIIEGRAITITWINDLSWVEGAKDILRCTVKYQDVAYRVEYNTKTRSGQITPVSLMRPTS